MKNTLTVFLCGTYSDLGVERNAVLEAVRRLNLSHDSMEFFGARPDLPIDTCLAEVRNSDVLVVILGRIYGSLVPGASISFTEAEYDEGFRLKKPCLVYIRNDETPIHWQNVESDPRKAEQLENFKKKLRERHTVFLFSYAHDLAVSVAVDLGRTMRAIENVAEAKSNLRNDLYGLIESALNNDIPESVLLSAIQGSISSFRRAGVGKVHQPLIFLCHSSSTEDLDIVRAFARRLQKHGMTSWFAESQPAFGAKSTDATKRVVESADFTVLFLSKASLESSRVQVELDNIIARQVSDHEVGGVLTVLLEDVSIPASLRTSLYVDLRDGNLDKVMAIVITTIRSSFGRKDMV